MAKYNLWKGLDGKYYWHLYSDDNGKIVCWAEGYSSKQAAEDSIAWVRANAPKALVKEN